jgi:mono/diheme cytochrome c family protein
MKPIALFVSVLAVGCQGENFTWERMLTQHRVDPYQSTPLLPEGRAMQLPPAGTLPSAAPALPPSIRTGEQQGAFATQIPLPQTPERLAQGQSLFNVHCAVCHGASGDGRSYVAQFMTLMPPRSLVAPPVSGYPPGRIFQTVDRGFNYMRSYQELDVEERWAVVQYVRTLQQPAAAGAGGAP